MATTAIARITTQVAECPYPGAVLAVVPEPVTVRVPAKVNLHLAVGNLRADGYHELISVFQALSMTDEVTVAAADEPGIQVYGEGAGTVPTDERNLAWRAVLLLAEHAGRQPRVRVVLRKSIPVAGGMAGGSADAAGTLVGLAGLWRLDLSREELAGLAAQLGSDVPFALCGGTALGTGRGESLVPVLARHTFHWVIALDHRGLSTLDVYRELDRLRAQGSPQQRLGDAEPLLEALASGDPRRLALLLGNDLQAAAVSLRPTLRRTLRAGVDAGALAGIVSGSGPTCAFLCTSADAAVRVAAELAGVGVCRTVRVANGPVPGARIVDDPRPVPPHEPLARA
ncbi:MAG: 4-(cytidine 5'-diphospho)-2-C-methyl-D-erythritol kinase [Pseudonocardiales bacterium]|nr:4-(cytidine 5'-diphospho)-2-C-methyl-D-erythritol kinase [Pseudonocardiales bacterium]MBV9652459.1 4-(cytidine 5'-diphospho)-2-C-methyl-D-erythritol kinase [Pseudonocardiales bacterium]